MLRFILTVVVLFAFLPGGHGWAYDIVPEVGVRVERHDNVRQSTNEEDDISIKPYAGLLARHEGERLLLNVDLRVEYERHQDTFDNDTRIYADAYAGFIILPGRLLWNLQDTATIARINPTGFDLADNTQRVNVLATGPEMSYERNVWRLHGKVQLSQVTYEESDEFDSDGTTAGVSLVRDLNDYSSLGISYGYHDNEYDSEATITIQLPDQTTVDVPLNDYEVTKYYLEYNRELPYGLLTAKLGNNEIDTDGNSQDETYYDLRLVYDRGGNLSAGVTLRSELTDPVVSAFSGQANRVTEYGIRPPSRLGTNDNPSFYKVDEFAVDLRYDLGRYHAGLQLFSTDRDYYGIEPSDDETGIFASLNMELTERSSATLSYSNIDTEYTEIDLDDKSRSYGLSYEYQWSPRVTFSGGFTQVKRSSNLDFRAGDDNILFVEVNYRGEEK